MDRRQFCWTVLGAGTASTGAVAGVWAYTPPNIRWHKELKPAYRISVQQNKPMLILFSATWCTYCHKLLRETLGEKKMIAFVEQKFVPVLLDFDKDKHIAEVLEVESLPCTVVLSPLADLLLQKTGFQKSDAYLATLQSALVRQEQLQQAAGEAP